MSKEAQGIKAGKKVADVASDGKELWTMKQGSQSVKSAMGDPGGRSAEDHTMSGKSAKRVLPVPQRAAWGGNTFLRSGEGSASKQTL